MMISRCNTFRVRKDLPLFLLALLFTSLCIKAQIPNNAWRDHLAYNSGTTIAITPDKVFCAMSSGGMLSYRKSSGEIEKMSKVTGLSDINISAIAYSTDANILIIGYNNGNIDLLTNSGVINMPDIKQKRIAGIKTINKVTVFEDRAFLSCDFGIVEINLNRLEISDSYFFGPAGTSIKVNDVAILNGFVYAATELGVYKADLNAPNLVDFTYWTQITEIPNFNSEYKIIESFENEVFAMYKDAATSSDKIILLNQQNTWEYWNPVSDTLFYDITYYNNQVSLVAENMSYFFNSNLQTTSSLEILRGRHVAVDEDGTLYAAAAYLGFLKYNGTQRTLLDVTSPRYNTTGLIATKGDQVWVGSGGPFNVYYQGAAHIFSNEKWSTLYQWNTEELEGVGNFYKFSFHPSIENKVFASSYAYALFEIQEKEVIASYNRNTVPIFADAIAPEIGIAIAGQAFDRYGNLWIVNDITVQPLFVLRNGGDWEQEKRLNINAFKTSTRWSDILVTQTNQIWILSERDGMVVLQEQPDGSIIGKEFAIKNQKGDQLSMAYCMTEDNDGNIWVGTNKGPIVYSSSNQIFDNPEVLGNQIVLSRNDGTNAGDILLDYERINDIVVDGGNRKWLATETSGIFLVSDDGKKTLQQFNTDNSPMISNNVISVGVQEKTGEVFISTNEGLIAFMGRATEGLEDFTDVYVYPNPVRPEYNGDITVSGLIDEANVKVTDISGNLVYETTSLGGQAVWDGKNFDGQRVQTGVYLVFMTNIDGSKTHITKLVFIH